MHEVIIEADEPWHDGLRRSVAEGILAATDSSLGLDLDDQTVAMFDADAQLAANVPAYIGYGSNAHPAAEGFVFETARAAQFVADCLLDHVGHEATVHVWEVTE